MGTVVTIGNFDGVHLGHQALLEFAANIAKQRGLSSLAITFEPHPALIHNPGEAPQLITGVEEKLEQIKTTGIGRVEVIPYTKHFAAQSDIEFIQNYLVNKYDAKVIVLGSDAKFGKGNTGDLSTLRAVAPGFGFEVLEFHAVGSDESTRFIEGAPVTSRWSSSAVRDAIGQGDMPTANQILGRNHSLTGLVVHGDHRGRELGFPTANLADIQGLIPPDGVYAGYLKSASDEPKQPAAISIGTNPTFTDVNERRVEAYVLGRDDLDLYGQTVRLEFVKKIRDTLKFDSVAELIETMNHDVAEAKKLTIQ